MVADLRAHGNVMKPSDLARYFAAERDPYRARIAGTRCSQRAAGRRRRSLAAKLNSLEAFGSLQPYPDDAGSLHAMIAAWQLVPSTRNRIADPGLWSTNVEPFTNKDTARARWRCFDRDKAISPGDAAQRHASAAARA
jgi:gamma-glutamyltranspeptidase